MYVIVIQIKSISPKCMNFIDIVDLKVITMTYFSVFYYFSFTNENNKFCLKIANIQFSFTRCSQKKKKNTQKHATPHPIFLSIKATEIKQQ